MEWWSFGKIFYASLMRRNLVQLNGSATRGHDAFLNSYAEADEGLYDDFVAR